MNLLDYIAVTVGYLFLGGVLILSAIVMCLLAEDAFGKRRARHADTVPLPRLRVVPDWDAEMDALIQDFRGGAA